MESEVVLALIAVILAALAFIVAFLQVILEYMSSSNVRNMCSKSAIGPAAKQTRFGWSFLSWKLKVRYPLLKLSMELLLFLFVLSQSASISRNRALSDIADRHGWGWRSVKSNEKLTWKVVADNMTVMTKGGKDGQAVTIEDLTDWGEYLQFLWYRLRHRLHRIQRPRASWAQILAILGIKDTKILQFHLVDAESIPVTLDTPVQRINIRHLGRLAFNLGFNSVSLDIPKREFKAFSPFGTITTTKSDEMGKVLRFEGDIIAIHKLICRCAPGWVWRGDDLINGCLSFGKYVVTSAFIPLPTLAAAILNNFPTRDYDNAERQAIREGNMGYSTGPVYLEATLMRRYLSQKIADRDREMASSQSTFLPESRDKTAYVDDKHRLREVVMVVPRKTQGLAANITDGCASRWQEMTGSKIPTMYAAATFVSIHGVATAFPSRAILVPFVPWIRRRSNILLNRQPPCVAVSNHFSKAITAGSIGFARETSDYLLSTGTGDNGAGVFGWGFTKMYDLYKELPIELQRDLVPNEDKWQVNAIVMPETARLLKSFETDNWAKSILEAKQTLLIDFKALNSLWIQIMVLDIAIQFFIHGHWGFRPMEDPTQAAENERKMIQDAKKGNGDPVKIFHYALYHEVWGHKEAAVVQGIVRAWRDPELRETQDEIALDEARNNDELDGQGGDFNREDWNELGKELREWDLAKALLEEPSIQFGDDPAARIGVSRIAMCRRLADLLELRAIFVLAFLLLHPDSSDLYESARAEEDIEMPIA